MHTVIEPYKRHSKIVNAFLNVASHAVATTSLVVKELDLSLGFV